MAISFSSKSHHMRYWFTWEIAWEYTAKPIVRRKTFCPTEIEHTHVFPKLRELPLKCKGKSFLYFLVFELFSFSTRIVREKAIKNLIVYSWFYRCFSIKFLHFLFHREWNVTYFFHLKTFSSMKFPFNGKWNIKNSILLP